MKYRFTAYMVYDTRNLEWHSGYNGSWIWKRKSDANREAQKSNKFRDGKAELEVRVVQIEAGPAV